MLKGYANYFVAYLFNNLKNADNIKRIVLYGSAAKGETNKDSDIDLFIEINRKNEKFSKEIYKIEKNFYESREATLFKSKGVNNKFDIKIGFLKEWKLLYRSIASTGIILYGHYEAEELPSGVKHFILIFWDKIEINRGAFLNKVYGFKIGNKRYSGMLEKFDGKRTGKSCIMLPIENKDDIFRLLREHKVNAKTIEVFV